ncbi:hypothetical protein ABH007_18345 [Bacteroides thetaiotaomicron]|jgi:hypothetical protein|uniref:hypothetical protein n=1 Tax=Bacteroides thetaiotaomicron TaxID=818 RepID=UPI00232B8D3F|nr:hypothetical protein [Bacteroides thetaiotaomicron]MDC2014287.1 hypothetical protein [Bacteroides thetaiotaomicron]MDC2018818.1 hypothetical protein [Bacteroides thetaiotaomicron]MDC2036773.1 hypothetical protein [Bacteroides thetaiotaomicron]MDC2041048.1 hypothetical protein [Bacteroides thetaiotaomicron]MDC2044998.1 hypothetical protein [Bacteroides thetaiotaomicron]
MSKKCLKCGISITDGSSDYCYQCGKDMQQKKQCVPKGIDEEAIGKAESVLNIIAKATLILGTITAIIMFFVGVDKFSDYEIGIELIIASIVLLISSVITWATLKVFCNISNNLQEINKKMKG